jgi:hypothetical protein
VTKHVLAWRRGVDLGLQTVFDIVVHATLVLRSFDNFHTRIELMFAAELCAKDWGELSRESDTGDGNGGESHDGIAVVKESRRGEETQRWELWGLYFYREDRLDWASNDVMHSLCKSDNNARQLAKFMFVLAARKWMKSKNRWSRIVRSGNRLMGLSNVFT